MKTPLIINLNLILPDISIKTIREELLQKDEAILSYYNTGKRLICFYITKENFGYTSKVCGDNLSQEIFSLRKELALQDEGDKKTINKISASLYSFLVKPVRENIKSKKHLVIIPYNEISYIPFEILIDSASSELLLNSFAISYNYSVNFLQRHKAGNDGYKVLAFAPFTKHTTDVINYPLLKSSEEEVTGLQGKVLISEQATKSNFLAFESRLSNHSFSHTCHSR